MRKPVDVVHSDVPDCFSTISRKLKEVAKIPASGVIAEIANQLIITGMMIHLIRSINSDNFCLAEFSDFLGRTK